MVNNVDSSEIEQNNVNAALPMYAPVGSKRSLEKADVSSAQGPTRNARDEIRKKLPKKNSLANFTGIMMLLVCRSSAKVDVENEVTR
jgi:hypothetical protein